MALQFIRRACAGRLYSQRMRSRKWPASVPALRQPRSFGTFLPPDPNAPQAAPLPRQFLPLPNEFDIGEPMPHLPPMAALQGAMLRHRLLFLWYAHPAHAHVSGEQTPDKGDLYDALGLEVRRVPPKKSADAIFEYEAGIEAWLAEQEAALGTGTGRPLRDVSQEFPVAYFASWVFEPAARTPLQSSYEAVAGLVGSALAGAQHWLRPGDREIILGSEHVARPAPVGPSETWTWRDHPPIRWDYPDRLRRHALALQPLVLIERGGRTSAALPSGAASAVEQTPEHPFQFKRDGDTWHLKYQREGYRFAHSEGFRFIHALLSRPGSKVAAAVVQWGDMGLQLMRGSREESFDDETLRQARASLEEGRLTPTDAEKVKEYLRKGKNHAGKLRRTNKESESARKNVSQRVRFAVNQIREHMPGLAGHLDDTIDHGTFLAYLPPPPAPDWQI